ncbi:MAG TPA: NHL repeat-containing protein [Verrucomicrobiae bacterium]
MKTSLSVAGLTCVVCSVFVATAPGQSYTFVTLSGGLSFPDGTNRASRFGSPFGVAADSAGNIFVADGSSHTIRKLTRAGTNWVVNTIAGRALASGAADGTNDNARFLGPQGIAVDTHGNIFVADTDNQTIRKIALTGTNWVVTTIAGVVGVAWSADGTNNHAYFSQPGGLAIDRWGTIFVADSSNNRIRKITPAGDDWVVTTIAGSSYFGSSDGTNSGASFNIPHKIAVDSATNLYVTDYLNNNIRKITPVGTNWVVTTLAGAAPAGGFADGLGANARFNCPNGIVADNAGNVFVADSANNSIRVLAPVGSNWVVSTLAGFPNARGAEDGTNSTAHFNWPYDLALDTNGDLVVAEVGNFTIRKLTPSGVSSTLAGAFRDLAFAADQLSGPQAIVVDPAGVLFVADTESSSIRRISPEGAISTIAGSGVRGTNDGMNGEAQFNLPQGIARDSLGNLFVADTFNHTIRKISPVGRDWSVTTLAGMPGVPGSADGANSAAGFNQPHGIAVDSAGVLYVADMRNFTVRRIAQEGANWVASTIAGLAGAPDRVDGTNSGARFATPRGLTLDTSGNLYVTESGMIRKIARDGPNWVVTTILGSSRVGPVDGTNAVAAFAALRGIAADDTGALYVTDSDLVRKATRFGADWVVTTLGGAFRFGGGVDGTGAEAQFSGPDGIAVDTYGNLYVADKYNRAIRKGVPSSTTLPALRVSRSANQLVLSWPLSAPGFVLEMSRTLGPGASWESLGAGTVMSIGFAVTNDPGLPALFYRLRR